MSLISLKTLKNAVYGKRILVDTNVIIYLTAEIQPYFPLSRELFLMMENADTRAVISILSIAEVFQGPLKAGKLDTAKEVRNYLVNFPNCRCLDVTLDVLQRMGNDDRVNWKTLRTVDSLIIASGLFAEVDLFVSNDRHFRKSLPPEMIVSFD